MEFETKELRIGVYNDALWYLRKLYLASSILKIGVVISYFFLAFFSLSMDV